MILHKRAIIYCRTGGDPRTTESQSDQLRDYARRMDYRVIAELSDATGATAMNQRPGFGRVCTLVARKAVDIVLCDSPGALSSSLSHFVAFLKELDAKQVDLFLRQQRMDTSTPSGKGALQLIKAFADLEKSLIADRIRLGIENARLEGKRVGRPSVASSPTVMASVRALRERGMSIHAIAKALKIGAGTTAKILAA
jgi:DNA invertase Pin-like site-specific DNA recombinase